MAIASVALICITGRAQVIYLDYQASAPLLPGVLDAMIPFFTGTPGNPHADDHAAGWEAADAIADARGVIAERIGADADEIVFTSGATEANNLAIRGLCVDRGARNRVLIGAIEHKSVIAPARALRARGFDVDLVPVDHTGRLRLDALEEALDERVRLVSVQWANNEIGTLQPIAMVADLCRAVGAAFHCDAAQGLSFAEIDVFHLGADLMSLSSHKAGGPKGIGALYVARDIRKHLTPQVLGGEQEDGLRAGTLPTPLCVGFAAALKQRRSDVEIDAWRTRRDVLASDLKGLCAGVVVQGEGADRHPGNLSFRIPGVEADDLIARLQPRLALARGSACTSGVPEISHVLAAIGLTAAQAREAIRLSFGHETLEAELKQAAQIIGQVANALL